MAAANPLGSELSADKPRVAVFNADYPSTLALVESLARAGVPLIAYHHHPRRVLLRFSRYINRVHYCPDLWDHERFPAWLERQLDAGVFDLIAPTSDVLCYHLARVIERLAPSYRAAMPTREALLDVLFKDRLASACARHGIATPATRAPATLEQALVDAEEIGYPLLLKPRSHIGNADERGRRIDNPTQLQAAFVSYRLPASQQGLLAQHPQLAWPLLQEYVNGDQPQLSCSGVLDAEGRLITAAATVKLDQSPRNTGIGTAFACHDDEGLIETCGHVASRLLGRGIFEIEVLRRTDGGPPLVIDVNPRVFGQIGFDIARGNNLPALWYASVCGRTTPRTRPRQAMVCLCPAAFLLANTTRIVSGPQRWPWLRRGVRLMARTRYCLDWSWRDPLASLVISSRPLRHPTTFIHSHIRERYDGHIAG